MSTAASQASAFYEEVVKGGSAFTFMDGDSFLVFLVHGEEVVPFWSSRGRMQGVQKAHPKYANSTIHEILLAEFLDKTLRQLEEENIKVGVNWSGKRLTGYDIPVENLRRSIEYWLEKGRP